MVRIRVMMEGIRLTSTPFLFFFLLLLLLGQSQGSEGRHSSPRVYSAAEKDEAWGCFCLPVGSSRP
ncbi:hypothetical protein E2C01_096203 [Portunus trituberculatus]|uniref:Uncharacterized protein n=1 Tax=Portunus trituberculatus TaxID=210409 RepID=A0A5B7K161_PORTR|nr:hypothetical protein [Portunus trituberculatus]